VPANPEALPSIEKTGPSLNAPEPGLSRSAPEEKGNTSATPPAESKSVLKRLPSLPSWSSHKDKPDTPPSSSSTSWTWPTWKMPKLLGAKTDDSQPMPKVTAEELPRLKDTVTERERIQPEPEESLPPVAMEKPGPKAGLGRQLPPAPPAEDDDVPLDPSTATPGRPVNALPAPAFSLPAPGQKKAPPAPPADDDDTAGPVGLTPARATQEGRSSSTPPAQFDPMHESNPLPAPFEFTPSEPQVISPNTAGSSADDAASPAQDSGPSLFQSSYKAQGGPKAGVTQPASMSVAKTEKMKIAQFALCRSVRGYNEVMPLQTSTLRAGQRFVVYAAVEHLQTETTPGGIRTYTFSAWELVDKKGEVLHHDPLGTATDVTPVARPHFYLAHTVTVPARMPAGEYQLRLQVYDMIGRQTTVAQVPVRVQ
jgi:hypothetical protein